MLSLAAWAKGRPVGSTGGRHKRLETKLGLSLVDSSEGPEEEAEKLSPGHQETTEQPVDKYIESPVSLGMAPLHGQGAPLQEGNV